jgi:hypothetical protein
MLTEKFNVVEAKIKGVEENVKQLNEKIVGVDSKLEEILKLLAK